MIKKLGNTFVLETEKTTYAFQVTETKHLAHLYYGRKIRLSEDAAGVKEVHIFQPGNGISYDKEHQNFTLDDLKLEMSSYGKGDAREPFICLTHEDGSVTSDFLYEKYEIKENKEEICGMPSSYDDEGNASTLLITLKDKAYDLILVLKYSVYPKENVITRSAELINDSENTVKIRRIMSNQLDLDAGDFNFTNFTGAWTREMKKSVMPLKAGKIVNSTYVGVSSNRANPFTMISRRNATEDYGDVYGFNLIYSGNHYSAAEVSPYGKIRFVSGINPEGFEWTLDKKDTFQTPEAVMTYSAEGFTGMSHNMHRFVRKHIVRGQWRDKERPILLNSWEACYFDISESKLLRLAKAGKEEGIELFVMDDGWFKGRNDDKRALGDWEPDPKKLPGGLKSLADKVKRLGLDFGIWVEPEMINEDSDLFRAHPDWSLAIPGKDHSEGRNERFLDLTRTEVQDYIIEKMSKVFDSADISYVKWDMNRNMSDVYSASLDRERQGEVAHRYMLGMYRVMKTLTEKFPQILFEGCAAGGDRFDLGILSYFPQIWASDDTDAFVRSEVETNYSYGYPMSVISSHVSATPNHQTLRRTPLETRFNVAAFGVLGYEYNFPDLYADELNQIKADIEFYKQWRELFFFGDFYRGRKYQDASDITALANFTGNELEWTVVSADKKKAAGMIMQMLVHPNSETAIFTPKGLDPEKDYHFYNRALKYNIKDFGSLINAVSPVHVRPDSFAHNMLAKKFHMDGELEDIKSSGSVLMYAGVHLKPSFASVGYNNDVRYYPDFGSRIYLVEELDNGDEEK